MALEDDAVAALENYAGLSNSQARRLVQHVKVAAQNEWLMAIAGEDAMPTSVTDVRALRLRLLHEAAGRRITPVETAVLFRLSHNQAVNLERRMRATYPKAIEGFMQQLVRSTATVTPQGEATSPRYEIVFDDHAAFDYAYQVLQRKAATRDVRRKPGQTLDTPKTINGQDVKTILGL